ncbi:MAG: AMP-binding protein [Oscillospiraceae bacterium]|nr:AMP-binding protein [Oscillospiraceae bacterium]
MSAKMPKTFYPDKVEKVENLKQLWEFNKRQYGPQPYFTYKKSGAAITLTYDDMYAIIQKTGAAFYKMGLMGQTAAIITETRYEWLACYMATVNGNGIVVPLDKELMAEQILNFLERAKVKCVIYSGQFAHIIEDYAKCADRPQKTADTFINFDLEPEKEELPEYKDFGIYSFETVLKTGEAAAAENCTAFADVEIDREKPCAYLFTSGTTGTSKAVMLSQKNISSNAYNAASCVMLRNHDVMVPVLPIHHTYESTCTIFAASMLGTRLCQNESLKTVMRDFKTYKPDKLVLVPLFVDTLVKKIWDEIEKKGKTKTVKTAIKLSNSLRKVGIDLRRKLFKEVLDALGGNVNAIICGGAPLNPEHVKTMDAFGISIWQGYGITECSPLVAVIPEGFHMKKMGAVGYPVFQDEVKIGEKDENGNGEILVKGDNVMVGYLDDEQATKEVFTEDGFFKTGDIGYTDKDGFVYITGRRKNIIILSNGKNIYPEEIEEYLLKIEGIKECAVIGRKKENGDDVLAALVFPDMELEAFAGKNPGEIEADLNEKIKEVNRQLPVFKQINEVEIRSEEFEKTTTKKIMRYKLK